MSGVILFDKALPFFKKKMGNYYSPQDVYNDFLFCNEIDLFIQIKDASICEVLQNGCSDESFFINRLYPYSGYVRIQINEQVYNLLNNDVTSISIDEITGLYNSSKIIPHSISASLFTKDIDYNYYNSAEDIEISELNRNEGHKRLNLDINLSNLFLSRDQLSHIGLNLNKSNPEASNSDKPLHNKEQKSIGLIIAALSELAGIDISTPNSKDHEDKLLPMIEYLDRDGKSMDPKTLAKYLQFAIDHSKIKTQKTNH